MYTKNLAQKYSQKNNHKDTGFLAFRDLPTILKTHVNGKNALDFGCGPGTSSEILEKSGFEVFGVDINQNMLELAKKRGLLNTKFDHVDSLKNIAKNSFDIILCSFILIELPKTESLKILKILKNYLKNSGKLIVITTSENHAKYDWYSCENDIKNNHQIKSGEKYRFYDISNDIHFEDYYYTKQDYLDIIKDANFYLEKFYDIYGQKEDGIDYINELNISPISIYILRNVHKILAN